MAYAIALVVLLSTVSSACSNTADSDENAYVVDMVTYTSEHGIRLSFEIVFDEDRVLYDSVTRVDGTPGAAGSLWPLDGKDHEGEDLDPLSLRAGTSVLFESTVRPDCDNAKESPSITFNMQSELPDGGMTTDTVVPANPEVYLPAIRLWCDRGIAMQAGGGSYAEGEVAQVALLINNPTRDEIHVELPALVSDGATWESLNVSVPAGGETTEIVFGTGVSCTTQQDVPWADGRILINGEPSDAPVADAWC